MATDIDSLQIKIQGTAQGANKSINQLIKNLNTLQGALKSIDTSKLNAFSSGMSKASANGTKFATSLNKVNVSAKTTSKSVNSLASAFGKFYASYFLVVRGVKSFAKSIKSTADYIESFNYYTVAFGKVASEWDEDWEKYGSENARNYSNAFVKTMNDTLGKLSGMEVAIGGDGKGLISSTGTQNLGLNIQEITQYASQLASVTNSLGQTGKTTLAISQSFTQLAGDISSLFNVDYSTVAQNLQSGLIGQSRALYKYGIDITNATLQTYAYKLGVEKTVSEMTQMEKQQLRVLAILDQSKVSFGDLANTINSPSNQMRQLTNNFNQLGLVLGQLFMPIVAKVLPVVNGLTIALRQLLVDIAGFFNIKIDFSKFGQGFNQSEEDLEGFGDELDEISEKAKKTQNRLQGFDNLNVISSNKNSGTSTQGNQSTIDLTQQIVNATSEYQKVWNNAFKNMQNTSKKFAKQIEKIFAPFKNFVFHFSIGDFSAMGNDVSNLVIGITNFFTNAIKKVDWGQLGKNIGAFLEGIDWIEILKAIGDLIWTAINSAITFHQNLFDAAPMETAIITAVGLLKFSGLADALFGAMKKSLLESKGQFFTVEFWKYFFYVNPEVFTMFASELVGDIDQAITKAAEGTWAEGVLNILGNALAGAVTGGVLGAWVPGGLIAGAIVGAVIGALNGMEIEGESILSIIGKKIFNFDIARAWLGQARESFKTAFDGQRKDWLDMGGYIFEGLVEGFVGMITVITEPFADLFAWMWDGICGVFGIHSPAKEMNPLGENIFLGIIKGFEDCFSEFTSSISKFWREKVAPWFSKDKWKFDGVAKGMTQAWENAVRSVKLIWNKFANFLNSKLTWTIDPLVIFGKTLFKGTTISLGKIPTFATYETGGFPEDGFFFANHNELVGKFSNGQTAVANNEQIVSGIERGVESAVSRVLAPYLADIADSSRKTANKNFGITSREVFNAARTEANNYSMRTGKPAFS